MITYVIITKLSFNYENPIKLKQAIQQQRASHTGSHRQHKIIPEPGQQAGSQPARNRRFPVPGAGGTYNTGKNQCSQRGKRYQPHKPPQTLRRLSLLQ